MNASLIDVQYKWLTVLLSSHKIFECSTRMYFLHQSQDTLNNSSSSFSVLMLDLFFFLLLWKNRRYIVLTHMNSCEIWQKGCRLKIITASTPSQNSLSCHSNTLTFHIKHRILLMEYIFKINIMHVGTQRSFRIDIWTMSQQQNQSHIKSNFIDKNRYWWIVARSRGAMLKCYPDDSCDSHRTEISVEQSIRCRDTISTETWYEIMITQRWWKLIHNSLVGSAVILYTQQCRIIHESDESHSQGPAPKGPQKRCFIQNF